MTDQLIAEIAEQSVEVWAYQGERLEYRTTSVYTDGRAGWYLNHGDFDCDGKQDRLYSPEKGTEYIINTASGKTAEVSIGTPRKHLYVGDFNGDRCDDVMGYNVQDGNAVFHYMSRAGDLSHEDRTLKVAPRGDLFVPIIGRFVPPDATDDIIVWGIGTLPEQLFAGDSGLGFVAQVAPILNDNPGAIPVVGDFYDRRGVDDLLMYNPGLDHHNFYVFDSNVEDPGITHAGDSGLVQTTLNVPTSGGTFVPVVADFDGNGWDDIYWYSSYDSSAGDSIYVSDGRAFRKYPDLKPDEAPQEPAWGQAENGLFPVAFDIDSNGRPDLFWWRSGTTMP